MSAVSTHVADSLARKVSAHGLVVWDDPERAYLDTAESLIPDGAGCVRFGGSWYELRRRAESLLQGTEPPSAVIYVPVEPPEEDPLAEIRAASGLDRSFRLLLGTAIRQAMEDRMTAQQIDDVVRSSQTLAEAEQILEQGGGGPVQLAQKLGVSEPVEMVLRIACGEATDVLDDEQLRSEAAKFLEQQLGGDFASVSDLQAGIARRLLRAELAGVGADLAASDAEAVTRSEISRAQEVLRRWQADRQRTASLRNQMTSAAEALDVPSLEWAPALANLDGTPAFESLALERFLELHANDDFDGAARLADTRLSKFWAKWDPELDWQAEWTVAHAIARLRALCHRGSPPPSTPADLFLEYESRTWEVDAEHRRLELALTRLDELGELESPVQAARAAYEDWLDEYLRRFTKAVDEHGIANGNLLRQGEIHDKHVDAAVRAGERVAYLFVDALRYELGRELVVGLQRAFGEDSVRIEGAVGAAPSITPVGMANLCPGAHAGLRLELDDRDRTLVSVGGSKVMSPPERLALLQAAHGSVVDVVLDDLVTLGEQDVARRIEGAKMVMVRSQEIDEAGEAGKLAVAHTSFPIILDHLRRAVAKLSLAGITRFVISSDHGFLVLSRDVGQHRIIPKPGGKGEVHRRVFIGSGGAAGDELMRVPLSAVGIPGDLDLLVPRGLGLIAAGGARGFFHGGISPQEMLVPVITVQLDAKKDGEPLTVDASIAGRVTSRIFTGKLTLKSGLFAIEPVDVTISAFRVSDGREVAKLVAAGGAEIGEGVGRLTPDAEALVSFQVVADLAKGDKIELRVMDVATDRRLARSKPAQVAINVLVESDLDA